MEFRDVPKITPKAARVNCELTQEEAARLLGISKTTIQSYESGETTPPWDVVDGMEKVYGYPASLINFSKNSLRASKRKRRAG